MALVEVKEGFKTRYMTEEQYKRYKEQQKDDGFTASAGDITCSNAKSVCMGFSTEQYNSIFRKEKNPS